MSRRSRKNPSKRQQRKQEAARASLGSPYRRIGQRGEAVACYVNKNWQDGGMASIHVLFRRPDGGMALGAYLVDLWCMGLKDAHGRLDMTRVGFEEDLLPRLQSEIDVERVDVALVKRLVAGGIRFAQQNGFRLPHRYDRWTALLGDLGPIEHADLRDFGTADGRLRYVGTETELRKRLIAGPIEEFLEREDVGFAIEPEGRLGELEDEEADEFDDELAMDEALAQMGETLVNAVRRWCFAGGQVPHPRLGDAAEVLLGQMAEGICGGEVEGTGKSGDSRAESDNAEELVQRVFDYFEPDEQVHVADALDQIATFMRQFKTPMEMWEHLDVAEAE